MKMPTRREVEQIKARYTKGLRIELIQMDDPLSIIRDNDYLSGNRSSKDKL